MLVIKMLIIILFIIMLINFIILIHIIILIIIFVIILFIIIHAHTSLDYSLQPLLVQQNYIDASKGGGAKDDLARMDRLAKVMND